MLSNAPLTNLRASLMAWSRDDCKYIPTPPPLLPTRFWCLSVKPFMEGGTVVSLNHVSVIKRQDILICKSRTRSLKCSPLLRRLLTLWWKIISLPSPAKALFWLSSELELYYLHVSNVSFLWQSNSNSDSSWKNSKSFSLSVIRSWSDIRLSTYLLSLSHRGQTGCN